MLQAVRRPQSLKGLLAGDGWVHDFLLGDTGPITRIGFTPAPAADPPEADTLRICTVHALRPPLNLIA